jgi:hypothetical protein
MQKPSTESKEPVLKRLKQQHQRIPVPQFRSNPFLQQQQQQQQLLASARPAGQGKWMTLTTEILFNVFDLLELLCLLRLARVNRRLRALKYDFVTKRVRHIDVDKLFADLQRNEANWSSALMQYQRVEQVFARSTPLLLQDLETRLSTRSGSQNKTVYVLEQKAIDGWDEKLHKRTRYMLQDAETGAATVLEQVNSSQAHIDRDLVAVQPVMNRLTQLDPVMTVRVASRVQQQQLQQQNLSSNHPVILFRAVDPWQSLNTLHMPATRVDHGMLELVATSRGNTLTHLSFNAGALSGPAWIKVLGTQCPLLQTLEMHNLRSETASWMKPEHLMAVAATHPDLQRLYMGNYSDTKVDLSWLPSLAKNCPNLSELVLDSCSGPPVELSRRDGKSLLDFVQIKTFGGVVAMQTDEKKKQQGKQQQQQQQSQVEVAPLRVLQIAATSSFFSFLAWWDELAFMQRTIWDIRNERVRQGAGGMDEEAAASVMLPLLHGASQLRQLDLPLLMSESVVAQSLPSAQLGQLRDLTCAVPYWTQKTLQLTAGAK